MSREEIIKTALEKNRQVRPFFKNGFANHFSMVLWSYKELNVPDEVLLYQTGTERWQKSLGVYGIEFLPLETSRERISHSNWTDHIGNSDYFEDYLSYLHECSFEDISTLYYKLLPSLNADLFHPFIRYSFAILEDDYEEQLFALAYWCAAGSLTGVEPEKSISTDELHTLVESLIYHFTQTGNFVSLHFITTFAGVLMLPQELYETTAPYYVTLLKKHLVPFVLSGHESLPRGLDEVFCASIIERTYNLTSDHMVKVIQALKFIHEKLDLGGIEAGMQRAIEGGF